VVPDLLETTMRVRPSVMLSSMCFTAAGSGESSTKRSGNPILERNTLHTARAARDDALVPRTTT
jgi:hypothetical protein